MARFKVTAPVAGYDSKIADVQFRDGVATIDTTVECDRRAYEYFQRKGGYAIEPLDEDGDVVDQVVEDEDEVPPPVDAPARSASKADWVTDATSPAGDMSGEDAEKLTRDQLAERYLGRKDGAL